MTVDFGDDVNLVEKEVVCSCLRRDRYVVNRNEGLIAVDFGDHISMTEKTSVVNRGEGMMTVDFGDHVSLAEKEGACMARRGGPAWGRCSRMDGAEADVARGRHISGWNRSETIVGQRKQA
ncbi:hypothetical protein B296_00042096 [Ensete ventricosum]|uniref:Uncharacterized protein n=1 Tax=Ensete ventricosum TaxID=4639 RepID=A0A426Y3R6_ENSVE|nr:hypothetical protein B296_00042096 [Ensete ventricosum]